MYDVHVFIGLSRSHLVCSHRNPFSQNWQTLLQSVPFCLTQVPRSSVGTGVNQQEAACPECQAAHSSAGSHPCTASSFLGISAVLREFFLALHSGFSTNPLVSMWQKHAHHVPKPFPWQLSVSRLPAQSWPREALGADNRQRPRTSGNTEILCRQQGSRRITAMNPKASELDTEHSEESSGECVSTDVHQ